MRYDFDSHPELLPLVQELTEAADDYIGWNWREPHDDQERELLEQHSARYYAAKKALDAYLTRHPTARSS